jgi:ABC-type sugar transport system ATPase subunit
LVASGRSEVGRALFGLSPVISGQITLEDRPFKPALPGDAIARGVALIPEDRRSDGLVSSMSIRHNATLASLGKFSRASWINADAEAGAAKDALARCQTKLAHDELPVRALSGGNQQKVLIGKWLMTDPRLCFFDDPTRGIDIGAKDDIYRLLARLAADGMGILWVSSELPELLANAHRILVLHEGRAMGLLDPAAASQEDIMRLATGHPQLLS